WKAPVGHHPRMTGTRRASGSRCWRNWRGTWPGTGAGHGEPGLGGPGPGPVHISVAAELAGLHPQTLRIYEREGLLDPAPRAGGTRRYSRRDIARAEPIC